MRRKGESDWGQCINCFHEYEREEWGGLNEGCPVCGSKEFEPYEDEGYDDRWDRL